MAFAGTQELSAAHEYVSSLMGMPPTIDRGPIGATIEENNPAGQKRPEWMSLYYRDKAYAAFVDDLFCLYYEEDETPPTDDVVDWILESTVFAKKVLAQNWKKPHVTSDDEGGLRLSWHEKNRELRAIIPAKLSERYLYWQDGNEFGGLPNFGSATLYHWLSWVNERDR